MIQENVEAILAIDKNNGLAKQGKIPWKSKKDMKFFKDKTINNVVVMGSTTLLSLPNSEPLKDRINIVLTNNETKYSKLYEKYDNIFFVDSINAIEILMCSYKDKKIFIIGGTQIYNMLLPYCSKIWLTNIKETCDCDLFFNYDLSIYTKEVVYEDDCIEITCLHQKQ
jgi:dihydrofolate reductase